jgi:hypothetical protein
MGILWVPQGEKIKYKLLCVALFRLILIRISYIKKKVQIRRIKGGGYNSNTP